MIGLVDYDLQSSTSINLTPPNIEIMKLATYYKIEKNIFCRLVSFEEKDLTNYDKIYFFSESHAPILVPDNFKRANNVIFGGTAFTNGIYQPFDDPIIDYTLPKPAIYKEFLKQKYQEGVKSRIIDHFLDDTYYRCYAGNEELPLPVVSPKKRVFLYDINFFYNDWKMIIQKITDKSPSSIIRIHPIICNTLQQFFEVRAFPKIARTNTIILDLNIPLNEVGYMLKKYQNLFLADINFNSNVYLTLGGNFSTSFQYYKDFIYKLNLLYAFWARKIPIKLYYVYPKIGITDNLQALSLLAQVWSKNFGAEKTLRQKFEIKSRKDTPGQIAYEQLIKFYPSAKDLFDQNYKNLAKGGYWRL